jgi:hypothetical protein
MVALKSRKHASIKHYFSLFLPFLFIFVSFFPSFLLNLLGVLRYSVSEEHLMGWTCLSAHTSQLSLLGNSGTYCSATMKFNEIQ